MCASAPWTRRRFLARTGSCAAHLALLAGTSPALLRRSSALAAADGRHPVVARAPWGRLEEVADGVWALVSTPLEDRTTLCNGGIVRGRAGVLVVESFASDEGSRWMADQARRLAGRPPTHILLTHYHGDHTGGLRGAAETADVRLLATSVTRDLVAARNPDPPSGLLAGIQPVDTRRPTEIDLGGRTVLVVPRRGHTDSDLTVEVVDPRVVFCGDLVWNRMFPNYVDAVPSRLTAAVRLLRAREAETWVPGHGPLADAAELDRYLDLLDHVEAAAREARASGMTAAEAGAAYTLPSGMEDWLLFSPGYFERALGAWMEELAAG